MTNVRRWRNSIATNENGDSIDGRSLPLMRWESKARGNVTSSSDFSFGLHSNRTAPLLLLHSYTFINSTFSRGSSVKRIVLDGNRYQSVLKFIVVHSANKTITVHCCADVVTLWRIWYFCKVRENIQLGFIHY